MYKTYENIQTFSHVNPKTSPHANIKQNTRTQTTHLFEELVPSLLPMLKEHIRLGQAGIINHSNLLIPA